MSEFVHLHLHTEFSLLDGACRIDELLDQAQLLQMPALAVTEHGNMFSSVVFHDAARKRGINPILGCEVYVAPGDRRDKNGTPGETANHLVLLAENERGFKNLIKLVSAGYTEGFYYKPRIDKQLLAQHAEGLIGLSSCLKGEVATEIRSEQAKRAVAAAASYRDILGAGNFFLEMQYQGIDEQRIVNNGLLPIAKDLDMPLVATNDVHYLRHGDHKPHDILLCIGTGKSVNDGQRLKYHGDQFFLKSAEQMAEVFGDYPEALKNTMVIAERCNVVIPSGENHLPRFAVPDGFALDDYFEHVVRQGFAQRLERLRQLDAEGKLRHSLAAYEERLSYEIAMIKKMGYPGYFLIVWDFIRYAREQRHPRRSGPRLGGRQPRGVGAADHRCRSALLRPDLRALPEPGARLAARHRRRLLRAPPRRGDRIRHPEIRPRERVADHHVRHHEGESGDSRRRPRHGHALRRRRSHRQTDSAGARHDARQGAGGKSRASRHGEERPARPRRARDGQAPGGRVAEMPACMRPEWSSRRARSPITRRCSRATATKSPRSGR